MLERYEKDIIRNISHAPVLVPFLVPVRKSSPNSLSLAPVLAHILVHFLVHCLVHVQVHVQVVVQESGPSLVLESRLDWPGGRRTESLKLRI